MPTHHVGAKSEAVYESLRLPKVHGELIVLTGLAISEGEPGLRLESTTAEAHRNLANLPPPGVNVLKEMMRDITRGDGALGVRYPDYLPALECLLEHRSFRW